MARAKFMLRFAQWHIWLGWLIGFPVVMWTITGLVMVSRPIEYVHGDHVRAEPSPAQTDNLVLPPLGQPVRAMSLLQQRSGPVWVVTDSRNDRFRYSARDGSAIAPVSREEARQIALATYTGDAALEAVRYFAADSAPLDLRQTVASWQAGFGDGTRIYIRHSTGEVMAVRTRWWRIFDFMWGLHIMDLQTREDTSHPVLILFAGLAALGSLLGSVLLFRRRRGARRVPAA